MLRVTERCICGVEEFGNLLIQLTLVSLRGCDDGEIGRRWYGTLSWHWSKIEHDEPQGRQFNVSAYLSTLSQTHLPLVR